MDTKPSLEDLISATEAVSFAHENGAQDPHSEARNIVLNQINFMPRSRKELEVTLAKRKIDAEVAKSVLDRFVEIGLVDDVAYAELLIRSRCNTKRVSRSVLRQQLRQKGIADAVIQDSLLAVTDEDELRMATEYNEVERLIADLEAQWAGAQLAERELRRRHLAQPVFLRGPQRHAQLAAQRDVDRRGPEAQRGQHEAPHIDHHRERQ